MNAELDPLLSAYLDDELDRESRDRVEAALRSDPRAAACLADLARTREAVAALPRAGRGPDVSGAVVGLLAHRRRVARLRLAVAASLATGLAAAALLIVAFGPGRPEMPPAAPGRSLAMPAKPRPVAPRGLAAGSPAPRPVPPVAPPSAAIRPEVLVAETRARDDRESLRSLLGAGEVRSIDLVVDDFGPAGLEPVDAIVGAAHSLEPKHAKIHLVQSVEGEPGHSGRACVYVLVLDPHEYKQFRRKIDDRFPEAASEPAPAPPESLAALGSVGRLEVFTKTKLVATLMPTPAGAAKDAAIRTPPVRPPGHKITVDAHGAIVPDPDDRAAARIREALRQDSAQSPPSVYLVWVRPRAALPRR